MSIRKELRELSTDEWTRYAAAVRQCKAGFIDGAEFPNYDSLVAHHATATANGSSPEPAIGGIDQAHYGPKFLVYHSMIIRSFELCIQHHDPTVAAHYWDWTKDTDEAQTVVPPTSTAFYGAYGTSSNEYAPVGGYFDGFNVSIVNESRVRTDWLVPWATDGISGYMRTSSSQSVLWNTQCEGRTPCMFPYASSSPHLQRVPGMSWADLLGTTSDLQWALNSSSYRQLWCRITYSRDNPTCPGGEEGGLHGMVHVGVAGAIGWANPMGEMFDVRTSPNDPIFFAIHSMIEKIFQSWQNTTGIALQTLSDPCGGYDTSNIPWGHQLNDPIVPIVKTFGSHTGETASSVCSSLYGKAPYAYSQEWSAMQ